MKKCYWLGLILLSMLGLLIGCAAPVQVATLPPASTSLPVKETQELGPEVSPDTVASLLDADGIVVIDVREVDEFASGHISGATLIPLGELPSRVDEIPTDKPVIMVCRSGNRSGQAYNFLTKQGFDNVHNMTGGMNAWQSAGLEVEK